MKLNDDEFILKNYSENTDLAEILIEEGIIEKTGKNIR